MQSPLPEIMVYATLWALFGLLHSGMASEPFKQRWRRVLGRYGCLERLLFNIISILALLPVMVYGHHHLPHTAVFQPDHPVVLAGLLALQGVGMVFLFWSLSTYDLPRFAGFRQIGESLSHHPLSREPLHISRLHRHVRHPIYTSMLVVVWARPWDILTLATNLCATLYLVVGVILEERRLVALYGEDYRRFQGAVPMLLPRLRPWSAAVPEHVPER